MQDEQITYHYELESGDTATFTVQLNRPPSTTSSTAPDWTSLGYHRCDNCPLAGKAERCPTAVDTAEVVERFAELMSYHRAKVTVTTLERDIVKETDIQTGLHSLLGLIMATSGCPVIGQLRAMAVHHLPFATPRETLYRTAANHLLKQYFKAQRGEHADFELDELRALYSELKDVNGAFVDRIRAAASRDANLNAVVLLFTVSALVEASLDDDLAELSNLY